MAIHTIQTNFCGIPLAWAGISVEAQRDIIELGLVSGMIQRITFDADSIRKTDSIDFSKDKNGYSKLAVANKDIYDQVVNCPMLVTSKINKAYLSALCFLVSSTFCAGLRLGIQFSAQSYHLAPSVTRISSAATALSLVGFLWSCYKFQEESYDVAIKAMRILNLVGRLSKESPSADLNDDSLESSHMLRTEYRFVWSSVFGQNS